MSSTYDNARPGGSITRSDLLAWGTVRAGLALTFLGGLMMFLGLVLLVAVILENGLQLQSNTILMVLVTMSCAGSLLAGMVLTLSGICMSSAAPPDSGAKGWGISTCIFAGLTFLMLVAVVSALGSLTEAARQRAAPQQPGRILPQQPGAQKAGFTELQVRVMVYAYQGVSLLCVVCYLLCLRAIAEHFDRNALASGIAVYLICCVLFVLGLTIAVHAPALMRDPKMVEYLAWGSLAGCVGLGVWGLVLVGMVRSALTNGLLRS